MYLNIVNNSFFENRRNKKKEVLSIKEESNKELDIETINDNTFDEKTFLSIFLLSGILTAAEPNYPLL